MYSQIQETVNYFRSKGGYDRLFYLFREEVIRYGRVKGVVILKNATDQEKECLDGIMPNINFKDTDIKVRLLTFEKRLKEKTVYDSVNLDDLLECYFSQKIVSKKEVDERKRSKKVQFIEEVSKYTSHPYYQYYIVSIKRKGRGYKRFMNLYEESSSTLRKYLSHLSQSIQLLPLSKMTHVAMFAAKMTKDPHAYDIQTSLGDLFFDILTIAYEKEITNTQLSSKLSIEDINDVLNHCNLIRDDISSDVIFTGLYAKDIRDLPIEYIDLATKHDTVLKLPLCELIKIEKFYPIESFKVVYAFENPILYKVFIESVKEEVGCYPPSVCTSGHFSYALWKFFDKLIPYNSTVIIKTNFDMDPEGLKMNDKLYSRYGEVIHPIAYSKELHQEQQSDKKIHLNRLKQLDNLTHDILKKMGELLKVAPQASYQENFLEACLEDAISQFME
ncbi:TIGR02679 domain-containing protein [Bacillus cereus]|uniref:DUF2399 domain-containing protein n=1 Tax=Bacillus cereus TaxID=1396 RepID=A0A2A8ZQC1_BACCE|nr:TIGR02679 domain-containing protein [Bacillus cereus]PFE07170.1 hypothetical protein CN307_31675 [Bacillus cereus]